MIDRPRAIFTSTRGKRRRFTSEAEMIVALLLGLFVALAIIVGLVVVGVALFAALA